MTTPADTATTAMKKRKKKRRRPTDEGAYVCPTCGERIVIPLDPSGGAEQRYVEDCPVCCNPNVVQVEFFPDGEPPRVWAEAE
jgi:hypothetical protein